MIERWQLLQRQSLPLEAKVLRSQARIREWYDYWHGHVYVAFSGGKDSTVLLHIVQDMYPDVPAVFLDTGLEHPEVRSHALSLANEALKPKMNFRQVIEKYGYPVPTKEQAQYIYQCRNTNSNKLRAKRMGESGSTGRISTKWMFLLDAPFKIGYQCCDALKKRPSRSYEKTSGRMPIFGNTSSDSTLRTQNYLRRGCNAFDGRVRSVPLFIWTENDIWEYIRSRGLKYASIYDNGWDRTGCIFCMFGVHMEKPPNRFQRLKVTHPKLYTYCMEKLGIREVLEYIGVPWE